MSCTYVSVRRKDLQDLIDYLEEDERENWEEVGKPRRGHIYNTIRSLQNQMKN